MLSSLMPAFPALFTRGPGQGSSSGLCAETSCGKEGAPYRHCPHSDSVPCARPLLAPLSALLHPRVEKTAFRSGPPQLSGALTSGLVHLPLHAGALPLGTAARGSDSRVSLLHIQRLNLMWACCLRGLLRHRAPQLCSSCSAETLALGNSIWLLIRDSFEASLLSPFGLTSGQADEKAGCSLIWCQQEM